MEDKPFTEETYQQFLNDGILAGSRCIETGEIFLPPRPMCPRTYSTNIEWVKLSGKGILAAFTSIFIGPTAMVTEGFNRETPYCTGVIELSEGPSISAQIIGVDAKRPETIKIGSPVQLSPIQRGQGEERRIFLAFQMLD